MVLELNYDHAPEQITVPIEFRGKSLHAVLSHTIPSGKKFLEFLRTMPVYETDDGLFDRDMSYDARRTESDSV